MKFKELKRVTAVVLALVMMLSASACSDKSWSVKNSDESLAVGVYIYYLYNAYYTASNQVTDSSKSVLDQTIENKNASDWIKDTALENCKNMLAVDSKMKELNLSLTDDEISKAKTTSSTNWASYGSTLEKLGVSQDSYYKATALLSAKYTKLFEAIYGKSGTKAVSDKDLETYFTENYVHFNYFTKSLTTTDADGKSTAMTDEQIQTVADQFNGYANLFNSGKTAQEVADTYKADDALESAPLQENLSTLDSLGLPDELNSALQGLEVSKAVAVKSGTTYYLFCKQDVKQQVSKLADSDYRMNVLISMKSEEFFGIISDAVSAMNVSINDAVVKKYKPSMFA